MTTANPTVGLALLGAGARGELDLASLARKHRGLMRFVAVAEPNEARRKRFAERFNLPAKHVFGDWRELLDAPRVADAVVNALPCRMHYESALATMRAGYPQLLEKPMALSPEECVDLERAAAASNLLLMVALQSRYNRIYARMRRLVNEGEVGRLLAIDCAENIGTWHFILSYVRGIHRHSSLSHSFVMAKGVHDLDLITWFAGAPARRVASFGELSFFHPGNAPPGAPERCTDGCPAEPACAFSALRQYVDPGHPDLPLSLLGGMSARAFWDYLADPRYRKMVSVVSPEDQSRETTLRLLRETDHGLCVFRARNDMVDHQTVSVGYENGVTASFHLNAFSLVWERTLNLHGTEGEIRSADFSGRLETRRFRPGRVRRERIRYHGLLHGGGDEVLLVRFAEAVRSGDPDPLVSAKRALESHLVAFAAEEARRENKVVEMDEFRRRHGPPPP